MISSFILNMFHVKPGAICSVCKQEVRGNVDPEKILTCPICIQFAGIKKHWRQKLDIKIGMSKEEALEKFRVWRESKKTCARCEGEKYVEFCPIHLICKEAENVGGDATRNDNRKRVARNTESETVRTRLSKARERNSLCPVVGKEESLSARRFDEMV